jgi:hypothetical protein
MSRQEYIDKYVSKFVSRKLLVFLIGSVGLFTGSLTGDNWVVVASAYISIEGFTKIITEVYKSRNNG